MLWLLLLCTLLLLLLLLLLVLLLLLLLLLPLRFIQYPGPRSGRGVHEVVEHLHLPGGKAHRPRPELRTLGLACNTPRRRLRGDSPTRRPGRVSTSLWQQGESC